MPSDYLPYLIVPILACAVTSIASLIRTEREFRYLYRE